MELNAENKKNQETLETSYKHTAILQPASDPIHLAPYSCTQ